jgi:hypothetical protein
VCGNSVNVLGSHNSASGSECESESSQGSGAHGRAGDSDGSVGSGNAVQAPVNVPVNVCGNSVNVLGSHNSASGSECESESAQGSGAHGRAGDSDGSVGSGNDVQAPVNVPVNVCGVSVNVLSSGNPASADCGSGTEEEAPDGPGAGEPQPEEPQPGESEPGESEPAEAAPAPAVQAQAPVTGELAHTGSGDVLGVGVPLSAGMLVGGYVLYLRAGRPAEG